MGPIEDEYTTPDQIATVTKKLTIMKWVDLLEEHVRMTRGVRKIPLSYLIRTAHVQQHLSLHFLQDTQCPMAWSTSHFMMK